MVMMMMFIGTETLMIQLVNSEFVQRLRERKVDLFVQRLRERKFVQRLRERKAFVQRLRERKVDLFGLT